MNTAENGHHPAWYPTEADTCPGCGATHSVQRITGTPPTVDAAMCTACGLHWATTVANPTLRIALSIVALLPAPQLRTAALLDVMRAEVTQRAQTRKHTMAVSVCFPLDQVVQFNAMATVDTTLWRCRICGQEGTARTTPQATDDAIAHLGIDHGGVDCPGMSRAANRSRSAPGAWRRWPVAHGRFVSQGRMAGRFPRSGSGVPQTSGRDARATALLRLDAAGSGRVRQGTGRVPGHSDPGFTLRTYTHLVPSSYERARLAIDGVFGLKSADGLEAA